jgi:hypothetical protein
MLLHYRDINAQKAGFGIGMGLRLRGSYTKIKAHYGIINSIP